MPVMHTLTKAGAALAIVVSIGGCGHLWSGSDTAGSPRLHLAESALKDGMGALAAQLADNVLRDDPRDTHALAIKADALAQMDRIDEAAALYRDLLARDAGSPRANLGLGRLKLVGDPAAAEALFSKALAREPRNVDALNDLGIARDLLGHHEAAQASYRDALAIDPKSTPAMVDLGLSLAMSGQGLAAIASLRPAATKPDANADLRHGYGRVLAMAGFREEAEKVLSQDMTPDEVRTILARTQTVRPAALAQDKAPSGPVRKGGPDNARPARAVSIAADKASTSPPPAGGSNGRGGS